MAIGRIPEPGTGIPESIIAAKGDLLTGTANDTPAVLTVGANGTTLVADSATATGLKWDTPAAGGMTLLQTLSFSGASVTSSTIAGTYKNLQVIVRNFKPATDDAFLRMRLNGSSSGEYADGQPLQATNVSGTGTEIAIQGTQDNTVAQGSTFINFYDYANTTTWKIVDYKSISNNATTTANINIYGGLGVFKNTSAITTITFFATPGNLTSGEALIYGVS
jgi:hypothetical protein